MTNVIWSWRATPISVVDVRRWMVEMLTMKSAWWRCYWTLASTREILREVSHMVRWVYHDHDLDEDDNEDDYDYDDDVATLMMFYLFPGDDADNDDFDDVFSFVFPPREQWSTLWMIQSRGWTTQVKTHFHQENNCVTSTDDTRIMKIWTSSLRKRDTT